MTEKSKDTQEKDINKEEQNKEQKSNPEQNQDADSGEKIEVEVADDNEKKIAELEDRLIRTVAEFENYKKRVARQYDEMVASAKEQVISDLLDIVDNFSRALENDENAGDHDAFKQGVTLIYNQMKNLLQKYNVTPIEAVGKPFDPNLHDALMKVASEEYEEGIVTMEISRGYLMGDRVIRHSKVGVSSGPPEDNENTEE